MTQEEIEEARRRLFGENKTTPEDEKIQRELEEALKRVTTEEKPSEEEYEYVREEVASGYTYDGLDIVKQVKEEHGIDLNDPNYEIGFGGACDDIYGPETQMTSYVVYKLTKKAKVKVK